MISVALCVLLFFAGHIVRDGWPGWRPFLDKVWPQRSGLAKRIFNPTQLARLSGALICAPGAYIVSGDWQFTVVVFCGVLAGYYLDMKHGEAAGMDTEMAVFDAFLSGLTSVVPLAVGLAVLLGPWHGALVVIGLLKPLIWKLSWRLPQDQWFYPTRAAAGVFGAAIGGAVAASWLL